MKRYACAPLAAAALAFALTLAAPAEAEDLIYNGTLPSSLQTLYRYNTTLWGSNILAPTNSGATTPAKSPSVSGGAPTNDISITGGTVSGIYGAVNFKDADAVEGNSITIVSGATVGTAIAGFHQIGDGSASANDNHLIATGGVIENISTGGRAITNTDGYSAQANYNTVFIGGGVHTTARFEGAYANVPIGSNSGDTEGSHNTVIVEGGTVKMLMGAMVENFGAGAAIASNNKITLRGGTITDDVYGAYVSVHNGPGTVNDNIVQILGNPDLSAARIIGSVQGSSGTGVATASGNTLQVGAAGISAFSVGAFQAFDFALPATLGSGGTMLTVTGGASVGANAKVRIGAYPGLTVAPGDSFTLIDASSTTYGLSGNLEAGSKTGVLDGHPYTLSITGGNKLVLTIRASTPTVSATPVPAMSGPALAALALLLLIAAGVMRRRYF
jgi:hypothetical protein